MKVAEYQVCTGKKDAMYHNGKRGKCKKEEVPRLWKEITKNSGCEGETVLETKEDFGLSDTNRCSVKRGKGKT